ncbi:uncharacterized protein LOC107272444 isoform X2 [Cephus cinctus]|uniref:Uncharacterized protein LOC107272444 isoform X2 n=1 Tax=Cephus cinctus TaxID=211228 RepID=A0AAJ7RS00_CEPCN|nr:uncharacterized protein LOC107272444 isoform X2 [Cephus cinctus]
MSSKRTNDVLRTEMTFRDLQVDERFKKLERVLKLSLLNKIDGKKMDRRSGFPMPAWSISSINSMDLSSTAQSLNTSCMCSEVVTSSKNLKKTLPNSKRSGNPLERMATSSLKDSPVTAKNDLDTLAMPPPSIYGKSKIRQQATPDADHISSITTPSTSEFQAPQTTAELDITVPKAYHHNSGYTQGNTKESRRKLPTVFYKWKVILNDQGQLLIKGTLENNRLAHSKPVIRRLTSTSVVSILKHTYRLNGNIVDDRHDLPDYVRGKFYNGFPEDWENVHQIWRSFVAKGCKPNFRWPTPITDSDDDLISEVTDMIFMSERNTRHPNREQEQSHTSVRRNSFNTSTSYKSNASVLKERADSRISATPTIPLADTSYVENSLNKGDEYTKSSNSSIVGTTTSSKLEDKLAAVISNLTGRNCSQEYIEKVTVMFDCLNYVVNYNKAHDENQLENFTRNISTTSAKNESQCENNRISMMASSISNYKEQNLPNSKMDCLGHSEYSNTAVSHSMNGPEGRKEGPEHRSKDAGQCNSKRDIDSESESETYSGVPRISADKIFRARNLQEGPSKHYVRKPIKDCHTTGHKRIDKVLTVDLERTNNIPATNPSISKSYSQSRDNRKLSPYDSSVSILENPSDYETHNRAMCQPHKQMTSKHRSVSLNAYLSDIENDCGILNGQVYRGSKSTHKPNKKSSPIVALSDVGSRERTPVPTLCQQQKIISFPKDQNQVVHEVPDKVSVVTAPRQPVEKTLRDMENKKNHNSNVKENETSPSTSQKQHNIVPSGSKPLKAQKTLSPPVASEQPISPRKATNNLRENTELTKKDYGSKANPKILVAWTPLVVYNSESESKCGLVFEGSLLNEAGHVVNRKFNTDQILRRVSSKIVETVRHEFFQLSGDLNDTKHIVPKELLKHCRSGCPTHINQFCDNWKSLKMDNFVKNIEPLDGSTLNVLSISTSSRGRRILPPLNYWNGERITLKDNNAVYSPGKSRDTCELSRSTKSRTSFSQDSQDEGKQKTSTQERNNSRESKKYPVTDMKYHTRGTAGRLAKNETKSQDDEMKRYIRKRRSIVQQLNFSSSDEEKTNFTSRRTTRSSTKSGGMSNGKKTNNSPSIEYTAESSSRMKTDALENSSRKSRMAKRQKLENSPKSKQLSNEIQSDVLHRNRQRSTSRGREQNIICTYHENVSLQDSMLSDDEISHIP